MSSIASLAGNFLQSVIGINPIPRSLSASASSLASTAASQTAQQSDVGQLSSFAQIAGTLQQLQQSNPAQFKQVTQQIATNLQSAASSAQARGNTGTAAQLNQLAADFTNASGTGQLPNLQDLAKSVGGPHGNHHLAGVSDSARQFLASLQANGTQNSSFNAAAIIQNTLTSAGI